MYLIRHLPTKTYYGIVHQNDRMAVTCFRHQHDAKLVANSLSQYMKRHGNFPKPDNKLYIVNPNKHSLQDSMESMLWIEERENNESMYHEFGGRDIDMYFVLNMHHNGTGMDVEAITMMSDVDYERYIATLAADCNSFGEPEM